MDYHAWLDTILEALILIVVWMEYVYDKSKDDKRKQKKTRTTKKTTNTPDGTVTEEHTVTEEGPNVNS